MNTTFFSKISLSLLVFTAIIGLFLNYTYSPTLKSSKQCDIDETDPCVVYDNGQKIVVQFLQEIEVEEELSLTVIVSNSATIKKMWVQGVNMYMGKTVILTDSVYAADTGKVYKARLFLGSCSEPLMRWQIVIQTENDSQITESWFFNFSTDRNKKAE